jgi:hypothetical protein
MSLMPCFDHDQAYAEGIVVGRLLAGYGEIELQMRMCLGAWRIRSMAYSLCN